MQRRFTIFLLAIGIAASLSADMAVHLQSTQPPLSATEPAVSSLRLGINMDPLANDRDAHQNMRHLDLASEIGASFVRIHVHWAWFEASGPGQDTWNTQQVDLLRSFLDAAHVRNIAVMVSVSGSPCWASSDPAKRCTDTERSYDQHYPPADPQDFANFLAALAQQYGDHIHYWEIWNKPNLSAFWATPDANAYAALLRAAYPVIKAHQPTALVLAGALAPQSSTAADIDPLTFIDAMYAADAKDAFDALSYHPHTNGRAPTWYATQSSLTSYVLSVPMVRQHMLQAGDTSPIWLTESGWTTAGSNCADCSQPELSMSEAAQAMYLAEAVDITQRWDYVHGYAWHELTDQGDAASTRAADHRGLFRADSSAKPAAERFAGLRVELDSLSPLITYPDEPYSTTVQYQTDLNTYVFTYTGSYTATYLLNLNDLELQTGRLRVGSRINDSAVAYPIAAAGPRYRRADGTIIEPDAFADSANIYLDNHQLIGDFLRLDYTVVLNEASYHLRYDIWLHGGTLVWQVSDMRNTTSGLSNFWGFRIGSSAATPAGRALMLPYLPDPVASYGDGTFFSTTLDQGKSHSYRFERILNETGEDQVSAYNLGIPEMDSAGQIAPLHETGYLAVSPQIADVLPAPRHTPSPYRTDLKHRVTLDIWGIASNQHFPWPFDAVRAWESPATTRVTVRGRAADSNPDCGNGVVVSIRHNDLEIWSRVIENGDMTGTALLLDVDMNAGDTLFFHINHRGENNWCDETTWQPIITTPNDTYAAARDWSDSQGHRNWRYLEYHGANGYIPMTWQRDHWRGSRPHSALWPTGGHPGEAAEADLFVRYRGLLDALARYGINDLNVIIHTWQRYGYDVKLPNHYPANPDWGGSDQMRAFVANAVGAGHRIALHENYADHYPDAPAFAWDNVAFYADGNPKKCWYNPETGIQSYCTATDKTLPLADAQGQLIARNYSPNAAFEDVDTMVAPWRWIDLDTANQTPHTLAEAVRLRKAFFLHQREQYDGPLFGEGGTGPDTYDPYYAGYVDGNEAQIEGRAGAALIPDFALRAVQPLQINQGMGYSRRFFFPGIIKNNAELYNIAFDAAQQDHYRARQIAYGHTGWLDGGLPWQRASLSDTMTEYYLMRALQTRYLSSSIERIAYDAHGTWTDLGGALQAGVNLYQPRVHLSYADDTHIMINGNHGSGWYENTEDFSHRQGEHSWHYRYWKGGSYHDMTWDAHTQTWRGPDTWCRIERDAFHPDGACEAALVWRSPVQAPVRLRAWIQDVDLGSGDGVTVTIWHDEQLLWNQLITNTDPDTFFMPDLTVDMAVGDTIAIRVEQNDDAVGDKTDLSAWITYQDTADYTWTVSPDSLEREAITLPANGWIAWGGTDDFLAYTAQQADGGVVDYSQSDAYIFARSRDGRLRTIDKLTTDGTAALVAPEQPGGRTLYATETSQVWADGTPVLRSSEPFTGSVSYRDANVLVFAADPYPAARQYEVTYSDLPAHWYTPDGAIDGQLQAYNLDDQGALGTSVPVSVTSDGSVSVRVRSGQRVLLRRQ